MESSVSISSNLDWEAQKAILLAQNIAKDYCSPYFSASHLLRAILNESFSLCKLLMSLVISPEIIIKMRNWADDRIEKYPRIANIPKTIKGDEHVDKLLVEAQSFSQKNNERKIGLLSLLWAICSPNISFSREQLKSFPITPENLLDLLVQNKDVTAALAPVNGQRGTLKADHIYKFCHDKTSMARELQLDPVVGRNREVRIMMQILKRRAKPNILIVGEPGVGKTALVDGLAQFLTKKNISDFFKPAILLELDLGLFLAGTSYRGEIEQRLKDLINEVIQLDFPILFIDEIHALFRTEGSYGSTVGNLLKPALTRGQLKVIGATTPEEFRKVIEKDDALNRRFTKVRVDEPDELTTRKIIESIIPSLENHYKISVKSDAILECIRLSKRYLMDRRLPDVALDLLENTMSQVSLDNESANILVKELVKEFRQICSIDKKNDSIRQNSEISWFHLQLRKRLSPTFYSRVYDFENGEPRLKSNLVNHTEKVLVEAKKLSTRPKREVDGQDIAAVISELTSIPMGRVLKQEKEKLASMEAELKSIIIGQNEAIEAIVASLYQNRAGLKEANKPIGSFFFVGPTGTGKTELSKALAKKLFDEESALLRFDMSEYREHHSAETLLGAPPGYVGHEEGGILVNRVRERPYCVILFDEMEKADSSIFRIFLQVLDEGHLHDRLDKRADFSNSIIIFTSNEGSETIAKLKEGMKLSAEQKRELITGRTFPPEFVNRLSDIVVFKPLSKESLSSIVNIRLEELSTELRALGIELKFTEEAREYISKAGFSSKFGARPLANVIRNELRHPLARAIVNDRIKSGIEVLIDLDKSQKCLKW